MAKVVIDTSGVPEQAGFQQYDGPVPPNGLYKAVWQRGWWTTSSNGKPMLKLLFLLNTDHKEKKIYNGCPVFMNITYEPSTMWRIKELFTALHAGDKAAIDYDESNNNDVTRIGRAKPKKTELLIRGQREEWNNQTRLKVGNLQPIPQKETAEDEFVEEWPDEDEEITSFETAAPKEPKAEEDPWGTGEESGDDSEEMPF